MAPSSVTQSQVLLLPQKAAAGLQPSLTKRIQTRSPFSQPPPTVFLQIQSAELCPLKVPLGVP